MQFLQLLLGLFGLAAIAGGSKSNSSPETLSRGAPTQKADDKNPDKGNAKDDPVVIGGDLDPVDPVDPDPTPVDPDPTPVDPNPTPVDPDPTPVDPDPTPVDPDPTPVDPDPTPVDPDPTPVDPDPTPVDPDPTPVDPDPTPVDPNPTPPVQLTDTSDGGSVAPTTLGNGIDVAGGRVTTLRLENADTIDSVRVTELPAHGNLTVNPDNSLALVMSGESYSGSLSFGYEVTYQDGSTQAFGNTVDVLPPSQAGGWGEGNFYMLETDENDNVIVEYGDNHRDVFISGSDDALSLSDIAALEGLSTGQITGSWLRDHPDYGSDPDMALDSQAGMQLWYEITGWNGSTVNPPSSDWLLFESGYEYNNLGGIINTAALGEDPLHPLHITSYGDGPKPVLNTHVDINATRQFDVDNVVFSDIQITGGVTALGGSNLLFDDVYFSGPGATSGFNAQHIDGLTFHETTFTDIYLPENPTGAAYWQVNGNMSTAAYISDTHGLLFDNTIFAQNGFAPDYRWDLSSDGGHPPAMFSHNLYVQDDTSDVTFRDSITMQGASYGAHLRSGAFVEDSLFLDNNAAVDFLGGNYEGAGPVGNYSLFTDNVITSGAHKDVNGFIGGITIGVENGGADSTLLDNIIAHLADPNNPQEMADREATYRALHHIHDDPYYDDTIIYNWQGSGSWVTPESFDKNTEGLDTSVLNGTTIQIFTQQLLGDPNATISDLTDYLRAQATGALDDVVDADLIISFFQAGFGLAVGDRLTPEVARFIPNDLGDGIRWDNRLNWSTDDLPGTVAGDSVDLAGNWVNYGGTTTINDLDLGSGGELTLSHGYLRVAGDLNVGENGGELEISGTGQFWTNGYADQERLDIEIVGGRFVNTGHMEGNTSLHTTGGGYHGVPGDPDGKIYAEYSQTVLATDGATYDVEAGSSITVNGSTARIGFDGELGDTGVLRLSEGGTLSFNADSEGFSTIEEFRTGAMGDDPNIASGVNLGLGSVEIDISGLGGAAGSHELISVDELIGELSDISLVGLSGNQDAHLVIDYSTDTLVLQLMEPGAGSGNITLAAVGQETDMDSAEAAALWEALTAGQGTYSDDLPTALYADDELVAEMAA